MTEPTDAEIGAIVDQFRWDTAEGRLQLIRAVLAKFGTPPAVAGEPVAVVRYTETRAVVDWYGLTPPSGAQLYTTPQPTQAQAGAVQMTDWDMRGQLAASLHCWHRLTPNEAAELVAFFKRIAARGIKGGQHGAE